jgi:voltage-gated potassium channel
VSNIRRFALAIGGLVGVTAYGVVGYMLLGYTFLDALYQTCMTITTVG